MASIGNDRQPETQSARPYAEVLQKLRGVGLRPTRQRLALARLLFEAGDCHVTAEALHGRAIAAGVRVSLATVYNTLHQFTEVGLLREVAVQSGSTYFDTNTGDHHHFYFEDSGELQDIPGEVVRFGNLQKAPDGTETSRVDVVIRVRRTNDSR